jgi:hypothetical protein
VISFLLYSSILPYSSAVVPRQTYSVFPSSFPSLAQRPEIKALPSFAGLHSKLPTPENATQTLNAVRNAMQVRNPQQGHSGIQGT